ncbi:MAG: MurR/RpiR family transcriptional regulator [Lachnospiraceae bacterium]|nr:MurR/RpiR family transcriptional regulator [Lachnospiraceae bacterium]
MPDVSLLDNLDPLDRIEAVRPKFTRTQTRIADHLTANLDTAVFSTLAGLSRDCGVSEISILKFAALLGYSGFSEMKHAFQEYVRSRISVSQRLGMVTDLGTDSTSILQMIIQKEVEGLRRTVSSLDPARFGEAVRLLSEAKRVFMFGSRSSFYLVEFFALELRWIREDVYALSTQTANFDALAELREGDVFLCISMPRYLRSTTNAISYAANAGVPTIAITDSLSSPLVPHASVPLLVDNEIFSYCDNTVPILAVITALLNAVGAATYPKSRDILTRNEKTWEHFDLYLR